jgi:hypothetical protein
MDNRDLKSALDLRQVQVVRPNNASQHGIVIEFDLCRLTAVDLSL